MRSSEHQALPAPGRARAEGEEVKIVNAVRIIAALLAALCWFMSARTKLTRVRARGTRQGDTIGRRPADDGQMERPSGSFCLYCGGSGCADRLRLTQAIAASQEPRSADHGVSSLMLIPLVARWRRKCLVVIRCPSRRMGNDWRRRVGISISGPLRHHVALSFRRNVARTGDRRLHAQGCHHPEQSERQRFPPHLLFPPVWNSIGRHHVRIDRPIPKL
jgi:hypothetical protein